MPEALHPGRVIQLAKFGNSATWGNTMSTDYPLLATEFLTLLSNRQIEFVVVGGIALLQHVQGRNTDDIDLIISSPQLLQVPELKILERSEMFAFSRYKELRVDFLFTEHALFEQVAAEFSTEMNYQVGSLPTATVDGLLILKLFALPSLYRHFDFDRISIYEADIMQLLHRSQSPDSLFLDILQPHVEKHDLDELAATLRDTRVRLAKIAK